MILPYSSSDYLRLRGLWNVIGSFVFMKTSENLSLPEAVLNRFHLLRVDEASLPKGKEAQALICDQEIP